VLNFLPSSIPAIPKKRTPSVVISGRFVTDDTFLAEWWRIISRKEGEVEEVRVDEREKEDQMQEKRLEGDGKEGEMEGKREEECGGEEETSEEEALVKRILTSVEEEYAIRQVPESVDMVVSIKDDEEKEECITLKERFDLLVTRRKQEEKAIEEVEEVAERELAERRKEIRKQVKGKKRVQKLKSTTSLKVDDHDEDKEYSVTSSKIKARRKHVHWSKSSRKRLQASEESSVDFREEFKRRQLNEGEGTDRDLIPLSVEEFKLALKSTGNRDVGDEIGK
jgi:hypothetical protein